MLSDEGFIEDDSIHDARKREELAFKLLSSLPRSRLAHIQRRIAPLLQFDVVGSLPSEVSLQILAHLTAPSLLTCSLVSRRWHILANDQSLWKALCSARGWCWKQPILDFNQSLSNSLKDRERWRDSDDEGMGDSDEDDDSGDEDESAVSETEGDDNIPNGLSGLEEAKLKIAMMYADIHSNYQDSLVGPSLFSLPSPNAPSSSSMPRHSFYSAGRLSSRSTPRHRHSAPSSLKAPMLSTVIPSPVKPDYKLLYLTHTRLHNRFATSSYLLSALQTRGTAAQQGHTSTIYCLQLYTYPSTGKQVLFTGSRDKSVRQWNLTTGEVEKVIKGVHEGSVLSLCVGDGYLATAGSDRKVVVWDLESDCLVKVISDHEDSVLCVRFDDKRLVSCSKDRTVRTYLFPSLEPQFVLGSHRAAVNAVSLSPTLIVSGSGDRSIRLWDAQTGKLLRKFEAHHTRGIASIDFRAPGYVVSGSSDRHLRLFDVMSLGGWGTADPESAVVNPGVGNAGLACQVCGQMREDDEGAFAPGSVDLERCMHSDLVRSVVLGEDWVISGSYDKTIKVWNRKTGAMVADLTGGHTGRIFCIAYDCTKIVSCGEDQRICIWDFSHGIDTSFIRL